MISKYFSILFLVISILHYIFQCMQPRLSPPDDDATIQKHAAEQGTERECRLKYIVKYEKGN
jgi:hypothetical protein